MQALVADLRQRTARLAAGGAGGGELMRMVPQLMRMANVGGGRSGKRHPRAVTKPWIGFITDSHSGWISTLHREMLQVAAGLT
jgi:hypothetical protein